MLDYQRALRYPFQGQEWIKKLIIGAVVSLVPGLNLIAEGYANQVTRQIAQGQPEELPDWKSLGKYFIQGVEQWVARLLYFGLLLLIAILLRLPLLNLPRRLSSSPDDLLLLRSLTFGFGLCLTVYFVVLSIWLSFVLLAGDIRYSAGENRFWQLLEFSQNVRFFSQHRLAVLGAWVSSTFFWALLTIASLLLAALPFIGPPLGAVFWLFNGFFVRLFAAHIQGQVAYQAFNRPPSNAPKSFLQRI